MQVVRIGLDLAKHVFQVHGVDERGKVIVRKTLRREAVSKFFANLPRCLLGMEASNGADYRAGGLKELGHEARLISSQFVTPCIKSNNETEKPSVGLPCDSCRRSLLSNWSFRPSIAFAAVWSPTASGS